MSKERGKALFDEAYKIINGERQDDYGDPEDSFFTISCLWEGYLSRKCGRKCWIDIDSIDVANMMILLKIARGKKHDNFVDICGYAALADDIAEQARQWREEYIQKSKAEASNDNPEQ